MIKNLSITALAIILILSGLLYRDYLKVPSKNLVIFYTSNLRGQIKPFEAVVSGRRIEKAGGIAFIRGFIDETIRQYGYNPEHVILLDTGDALFGSAEASLTMGQAPHELMIKAGYDAMAVGNMEFEYGMEVLRRYATDSRLAMLACNYRDIKSPTGNTFLPGKIIEKSGVKIGVVGLGHGDLLRNTRQENIIGIEISDIQSSVSKTANLLKAQGAELVILLSHHPQLDMIPNLSEFFPEIDIIIGDFIGPATLQLDRPIVCQTAPARGAGIGMVRIPKIAAKWELKRAFHHVFPIDATTVKPDQKLVSEINRIEARVDTLLDEVVAFADGSFPRAFNEESVLGNLLTDSMAEIAGTSLAFLNSGGIKAPLAAGTVTLRHLYEMLPFENSILKIKLFGWQIENIIEESLKGKGGFIQASGLKCVYSSNNPAGFRIIQLEIGGQPVVFDRLYDVAISDFMHENRLGWPEFSHYDDPQYRGLIRETLRTLLTQKKNIKPSTEKRFLNFVEADETLRLQSLSHVVTELSREVTHDGTMNSEYGRLLADIIRTETRSDFAIVPTSQFRSLNASLKLVSPANVISEFPNEGTIDTIEIPGRELLKVLKNFDPPVEVSLESLPATEGPCLSRLPALCFSGFSIEADERGVSAIHPWEGEFDQNRLYKVAFTDKFPITLEGKYDLSGYQTQRQFNDVRRVFINGLRKRKGKVEIRRAIF